MEVRVVGRIDAIRLKNGSKSIFLTIFKMLTWKKTGPGYNVSFERKTLRTLDTKNALVPSYYIDVLNRSLIV
jgi:hypothetical protein